MDFKYGIAKENRKGFWGMFYFIFLHPFVVALVGVVKYSFYLGWAITVGPFYLGGIMTRFFGSYLPSTIFILLLWGFSFLLIGAVWDEWALVSWKTLKHLTLEMEDSILINIQILVEFFILYWIIALFLTGCISILDWIGSVIKRNITLTISQ